MPKKRILRSVVRTLAVAAVGCLLIVLVAPFIKVAIVERGFAQARVEQHAHRHADALKQLQRLEPRASRYPSVGGRLVCEIIRCYMSLGDMASAECHADQLYKNQTSSGAGPSHSLSQTPGQTLQVRSARARAFLRDGPDWLANKLLARGRGVSQKRDSRAGYAVILFELEQQGKYDACNEFATRVLEKDPGNPDAKALIEFLETPRSIGTRRKRVRRGSKFVTTTNQLSANELREIKKRKLSAREKELTALLNKRLKSLIVNDPAATNAGKKYRLTLKRYNEACTESKSLERRWQNSTGARRAKLMDELHMKKGEISRLQIELRKAKAHRDALIAKQKSDPLLRKLAKELRQVRQDIQDL